jgi:uncharacterized coiled-coil DUF342 family protein
MPSHNPDDIAINLEALEESYNERLPLVADQMDGFTAQLVELRGSIDQIAANMAVISEMITEVCRRSAELRARNDDLEAGQ